MTDPFVNKVVDNLKDSYSTYKDCVQELDNLSSLIQHIRWVERVARRTQSEMLMNAANLARDRLSASLNEKRDRNLNEQIGINFNEITAGLVRQAQIIDPKIFPPEPQPSEAAKFVPSLIQRTSKHLSNKLIKFMTCGTKYRDYTSMAAWQKRKYNRRIMFIALAWAFALSGLFASIAFLTRDFITAQQNLAVKNVRLPELPKRLPAITMCSDEFSISPFHDYPTAQYPGLPLLIISMISRTNRTMNQPAGELRFPNIMADQPGSPVEFVQVTDDEKNCQKPGFDMKRENKSLSMTNLLGMFSSAGSNSSICRHCFRFGYKTEEILEPFKELKSIASFEPAIQLIVSKSRLFGLCQTTFMASAMQTEVIVIKELYKHASQLEQRGILDFNGFNYSEILKSVRIQKGARRAEFYCNVYFFSGYFYPLLSETNISYRYTGKLPDIWEKIGTGPFFNPYLWNQSAPTTAGPNREAIEKDVYGLSGLRLFVEDPESAHPKLVPSNTEFAILGLFDAFSTFAFKRMNVFGDIEYRATKLLAHEKVIRAGFVEHFHIGFDFNLFEEERFYTYSTMSWSEYVTDLFEFMGLFTGICIFTMIVAPANRIGRENDED